MEETRGLFVTKPVYGLSPQDDEIQCDYLLFQTGCVQSAVYEVRLPVAVKDIRVVNFQEVLLQGSDYTMQRDRQLTKRVSTAY